MVTGYRKKINDRTTIIIIIVTFIECIQHTINYAKCFINAWYMFPSYRYNQAVLEFFLKTWSDFFSSKIWVYLKLSSLGFRKRDGSSWNNFCFMDFLVLDSFDLYTEFTIK